MTEPSMMTVAPEGTLETEMAPIGVVVVAVVTGTVTILIGWMVWVVVTTRRSIAVTGMARIRNAKIRYKDRTLISIRPITYIP